WASSPSSPCHSSAFRRCWRSCSPPSAGSSRGSRPEARDGAAGERFGRADRVIRFGDDRDSGAGGGALAFLGGVGRWGASDLSGSAPLLRASLLAWLRGAQAQQPSMALIHQLAARALQVADAGVSRGDAPAPLRGALAESCAT